MEIDFWDLGREIKLIDNLPKRSYYWQCSKIIVRSVKSKIMLYYIKGFSRASKEYVKPKNYAEILNEFKNEDWFVLVLKFQ